MIHLAQQQRIAFVMSKRLGDSLLSMVVVNNLIRNGFNVTVYSNYLFDLKRWFPWAIILPLPETESVKTTLMQFDVLLHAYAEDVLANAQDWHDRVVVFDYFPTYRLKISMPDIQVAICEKELNLKNLTRDNGIVVPSQLVSRKYIKRVVIHPTSYHPEKNWLPKRFLQLAFWLIAQRHQPAWIVSASERKDWLWLIDLGFALPQFASLDAVACWLYESGWFIGNDSGIGHLASNLKIPTVTLAMRPGIARRWRPSWAVGKIVLPPKWLITKFLKERFWKFFISVKKVQKEFRQLLDES